MKIRTNRHWRHFKNRCEVPIKVLLSQFDWMIPKAIADNHELVQSWCKGIQRPELEDIDNDYWDGFIHYQGFWSHVSNYMRIGPGAPSELSKWHGYESDSMSTGTLILLADDGEQYQIASYAG